MSEQTIRIIYWATTVIFCAGMAMSAVQYLTAPKMKAAFEHLGFPGYFRVELAIAKFIGVIVLLVPLPMLLKEWAYAGFAITLASAFIAHLSKKDPMKVAIAPVVFAILLAASFVTYHYGYLHVVAQTF